MVFSLKETGSQDISTILLMATVAFIGYVHPFCVDELL